MENTSNAQKIVCTHVHVSYNAQLAKTNFYEYKHRHIAKLADLNVVSAIKRLFLGVESLSDELDESESLELELELVSTFLV